MRIYAAGMSATRQSLIARYGVLWRDRTLGVLSTPCETREAAIASARAIARANDGRSRNIAAVEVVGEQFAIITEDGA